MTEGGGEPKKERWMSVDEVAAYTGWHAKTVRKWIDRGLLAYSQPAGKGGEVRVDLADVERLIAPKTKLPPKKDGDT